ncbi:uncharacterized protein [Littorina saxatilis]|uniref:Uncharacterized protein n=1 Tax=Littorina saxatilis TaxID=31220 RepID=A0AAN9BKQ0_9CAEN
MLLLAVVLSFLALGIHDTNAWFFDWGKGKQEGCTNQPTTPRNGQVFCKPSDRYKTCWAVCNPGYQFPDGSVQMEERCEWNTKEWNLSPITPDCRPQTSTPSPRRSTTPAFFPSRRSTFPRLSTPARRG